MEAKVPALASMNEPLKLMRNPSNKHNARPEGVKTLLDDMAPRDPRAKAADPRQYVDMSFVQELESSGYLKQLYKR